MVLVIDRSAYNRHISDIRLALAIILGWQSHGRLSLRKNTKWKSPKYQVKYQMTLYIVITSSSVLVPMSYGTQYCRSDCPESSSRRTEPHAGARAGSKCAITYAMIGIILQKGYFWGAHDHADVIGALYHLQNQLLRPKWLLGIFRYHLVFFWPKRAKNTKWDFCGALWSTSKRSGKVGFLSSRFTLLPLHLALRRNSILRSRAISIHPSSGRGKRAEMSGGKEGENPD
jgi:hypothetical protein